MSIRESISYQVVCDECGETPYDQGSEYASWGTRGVAIEYALDSDWTFIGDEARCSNHPHPVCTGCGEYKRDVAVRADEDSWCDTCWAEESLWQVDS